MVTIYSRYEIKVFVNRSHKHRIKNQDLTKRIGIGGYTVTIKGYGGVWHRRILTKDTVEGVLLLRVTQQLQQPLR